MHKKKTPKLWMIIFFCVIWSLLYERNKTKFEESIPDSRIVIYLIKIRINIWAKKVLGHINYN